VDKLNRLLSDKVSSLQMLPLAENSVPFVGFNFEFDRTVLMLLNAMEGNPELESAPCMSKSD
jgi:hypothetical protein